LKGRLVESDKMLHYGRLLALTSNIKFGWKRMEVANTLAYYDTAKIIGLKIFIVQDPDTLNAKHFTIEFFFLIS
jgi:hypothetical protein